MDQNSRVRLSFTLLDLWMRGKKQEAIDCYMRLDNNGNVHTQRGKEFDLMVADFVKKNNKLPPELGGLELRVPIPKYTVIKPYNELIDVKVECDIWDEPIIYEIKNSLTRDAAEFANSFQVSLYMWVIAPATQAQIYRYDPVHRTYDTAQIWKSKRQMEYIDHLIAEYGPQIYEFFKGEGLI